MKHRDRRTAVEKAIDRLEAAVYEALDNVKDSLNPPKPRCSWCGNPHALCPGKPGVKAPPGKP